ncbi:MAG: YchF/TatD family DNA exonuclease, partial [Nitrospinota bacterium]
MTILIDSHAHLDMQQFDDDRDEVINRALDSGVKLIINVGATLDGSRRSAKLASNYGPIYASVGVHPHDADTMTAETISELKELVKNEKVIAIGETGLDYYREHSGKESQKKAFLEHLKIAGENGLPIIIHSRDAKEDTLFILKNATPPLRGVLHCFSGDLEMARAAMELGLYISFAGPITYPNAENLREVMREIPIERLLVETDCPYLAPQKKRGKRNEPALVRHMADKICEIKEIPLARLSSQIQKNIKDLFKLEVEKRKNIFTYKIRNSLYINLTNRCTNECVFCSRKTRPVVKGYDLTLEREPEADELIREIGD